MNAKAKELGMLDTHYVEPTGLSSQNKSSARDLAVLVNAAHQVPLLREYSTTPSLDVELGRRQVQFHTTDRLVANPTWDIGLQKTGFINEAGQCLVMQAQMAGRKLIMVLLDSAGKYSRIATPNASASGSRPTTAPPSRVPARPRTRADLEESQEQQRDGKRAGGASCRPFLFGRKLKGRGEAPAGRARVPRRRRDARRRLLDPRIQPRLLEPVGRRRDGQTGHQAALVVVDARGHAAHAQLQLLVVARDRGLADFSRSRSSTARSVRLLRVWPVSPVRVAYARTRWGSSLARNSLPTDVRCSGARPPTARTTCMPERSL